MREIIFKGKRTDTGEWVEGDLTQDRDLGTAYVQGYDYYTDEDGLQREPYCCEIDPQTVGQYTGMKDSTGKRIFEGDIVRNLQGKTAYITFLQQEMGYVAAYGKHDSRIGHRATGSPYDYDDTIEVCGNVNDNPELLEV